MGTFDTLLEAEAHLSTAEREVVDALRKVAGMRVYREYLDELRRARLLINRFRQRIPQTVASSAA